MGEDSTMKTKPLTMAGADIFMGLNGWKRLTYPLGMDILPPEVPGDGEKHFYGNPPGHATAWITADDDELLTLHVAGEEVPCEDGQGGVLFCVFEAPMREDTLAEMTGLLGQGSLDAP